MPVRPDFKGGELRVEMHELGQAKPHSKAKARVKSKAKAKSVPAKQRSLSKSLSPRPSCQWCHCHHQIDGEAAWTCAAPNQVTHDVTLGIQEELATKRIARGPLSEAQIIARRSQLTSYFCTAHSNLSVQRPGATWNDRAAHF